MASLEAQSVYLPETPFPRLARQPVKLDGLRLLGFSETKGRDFQSLEKTVHFFQDEALFARVWNQPEPYARRLAQYRAALSPGFHLSGQMPLEWQRYQTYRNRWCGAYWQAKGLTVIPTVLWTDERSFHFCFDAIERGSVVAVSALGCWDRAAYLEGFAELCRRLAPEWVVCYGAPLPEMRRYAQIVPCPPDAPQAFECACA